MPKKLVIVESPAKARTIAKYLGEDFRVESSVGHIRDIPSRAAELPEAKRELWKKTRFGIDVDDDFKPIYIVTPDSRPQVAKLKQALKDADELYLATDEDREGEAIAWHLLEVLRPKVPVRRMVFHEITPSAIREAVEHPRELNRRLVEAQEARRILDRLFGYEVSPVLWRRIQQGLSAGRVQSPAIRILVDREKERLAFVRAVYAGVRGRFRPEEAVDGFLAQLVEVDGTRVASGKDDFDASGRVRQGRLLLDEEAARELVEALAEADFVVRSVERRPYTRRPYPPFRTATLQQEAGRKLRFGARRTMSAAQRLYEAGYITYMRTDSTNLSETAVDAARRLVADRYGADYLPSRPRRYGGKPKGAQEAHEAIRPAGEEFTDPAEVAARFGARSDEARLYDLVFKRTVASQMKDAEGESLVIRLGGTAASGRDCVFQASGRTITFPGFLLAYVEGTDDPEAAGDDAEAPLPDVAEGARLAVEELEATLHETKPPARYTEASLIKRLEELGIGRPSTYASIISTIQDRGYVVKHGGALVPTLKAFAVVGLLERYFHDYVDYEFTAKMEEDLDRIAEGLEEAAPWLRRFYFGNGSPGLRDLVSEQALEEIDAREVSTIRIGEDPDGVPIEARVGQYGPYLVRGEDRASIPEDLPLDELTVERALELLAAPSQERVLGTDPDSGLPVLLRAGRFGPYVQLGERDDETNPKPKTASLFASMSPETVTLDDALRLLSLPRIVGPHPEDGRPIEALNGRFGPYLRWGKETRSLDDEEQIFTITLDEAVARLAQPKGRGRRSRAPLRELGEDPITGRPVVVKEGRYGPYVTDGETNASLRGADTVEAITLERASELLAERRAKGPAKRRRSKAGRSRSKR